MDAKRHAQPIGRLCVSLARHVRSSRFGRFHANEQVRVVTRSLSRLEVVRADFGSPRLSQDKVIIAKNVAFVRGGFCYTDRLRSPLGFRFDE